MKLLFFSNLYPPYHLGGWEMLCQEVAQHLTARGHDVIVLTSTYGITDGTGLDEPGIYRKLRLESDVNYYRPKHLLHYWSDRRANLQITREVMAKHTPDVVVVWGMWNLSREVALWVEELAGSRVVYYLAGAWPADPSAHEAYWDGPANSWAGKVFKCILRVPVALLLRKEWRPFKCRFEHVIACSESVRKELVGTDVAVDQVEIIYHGIDPAPYRQAAQERAQDRRDGVLRAVFVGSLTPQKGVHTAIEAVGQMASGATAKSITLDILGAGHPDYERHLHGLVSQWHLEDRVVFHRPIPRAELPGFLAQYDVLLMPSVWEEPQARISQEAMAAGLVLVATFTGGTKELLVDGENGLAFAPEDAAGLAAQLERLIKNPSLRVKLAEGGWRTVTDRFTISRMMDQFEAYLAEVMNS